MNKISICSVVFVLLIAGICNAEKHRIQQVEYRLGTGLKSIFDVGLGMIPLPVAVQANVDFNRVVRIGVEYSHSVLTSYSRFGINPGIVATLAGSRGSSKKRFQLKLPFQLNTGFLVGSAYAGDGYSDNLKWFLMGISTAVDLSFWAKRKNIGLWIQIGLGYIVHIDLGSEYLGHYGEENYNIGTLESSLILGLCF